MSSDGPNRIEVIPGTGLVVRRGGTLAVLSLARPDEADRLIGLVGELAGEALLAALAATLDELGGGAPESGAVLIVDESRRLGLAWGDGELRAYAGDAERPMTPPDHARTSVVPASADRVRVALAGADAPVAGSDLVDGVVPGAGAECRLEPALPPPAPPRTPDGLSVVSLSALDTPEDVLAGRAPLAVEDGGGIASSEDAARDPVVVPGVRCPRDHHNSPGARFCHRCGIRMGAHRSLIVVQGPRPPLGVLVLDDGSTFALVSDAVIGREPQADALVQQGDAEPFGLEDAERLASRAHARFVLEDWSVHVEDRGSINGTWIRAGDAEWRRLSPSERVELESGDRIKIGGRELLFEHHHE